MTTQRYTSNLAGTIAFSYVPQATGTATVTVTSVGASVGSGNLAVVSTE